MSEEAYHRRTTDPESTNFHSHQRVCDLRFEQLHNEQIAINKRLAEGDQLMRELRDLLIALRPVADEVQLHARTIYGADRQGGLVTEVRENREALNRINRTAAAIVGLVTTNIGTLIALAWQGLKHWKSGAG